jgi:SAM-dependent methyltransferase
MNDQGQILVFDRALLRVRRDRAAPSFAAHDVLFHEIAAQIHERLGGIKENFSAVLDLGAHQGMLARDLAESGASFVVAADLSEKMLRAAQHPVVVADEEFLPFASGSFDLVVSNMSLHWVNDLPGALAQIKNALRPGGLFLAAMPGGNTLHELRAALLDAELKVTGGGSPRLSPTVDLPDASGLLQRAGFVLPVTDRETVTLTYPDLFALMRDLRGMGEAAVHYHRPRRPTRRAIFLEAERIYRARFAAADDRLPASFEILFLHGRRPL